MTVFQKVKNCTTISSRNPTPGYIYMNELKSVSQRVICILMFTEALFTIAKISKQPKSVIGWMDKEAVIYI